ncbi:peptidylprolyl isomerase [Flavobacterium sp. HXWNR69]|jgi:peptidyl-prolyl cis-trans isomerase A (cyclophilin A)|uniref:peptidylprolyl isomerase n=1 Tax=Flavobacterium fragile TaxID=2949085 RepID=A0ABT0TFT4_9FLAO|nr:peptidylprolyl isomerase [Flavobacterium sp. HXWNR69]MCL9769836.1 peptidylprolyl isomerase [Flavobacterium sp. HXWNR69]
MKISSILLLSVFTFFTSCSKSYDNLKEGLYADIETSKGSIIVKLEFEKVPNTVANFVTLAEGKNPFVSEEFKGKPFYDGLTFHRVISDFMVQGGDPNGNGSGGPGYKFKDEFHPDLKHSKAGILSMANAGPSTNGSQFFITRKATPWLDNMHTVFGEVVEGIEVADSIEAYDVIDKITIIRIGNAAKKFDAVKIFKNYYSTVAKEIKESEEKAAKIIESKVKEITTLKATGTKTKSGLIYQIIKKGTSKKPANGTQVYINYAGYLENGQLFDTNYEDIAKRFGKHNAQRAIMGGYSPIASTIGNLQFIPGFVEGVNMMNFGDKVMLYIPSELGYGQQGAGDVIPPNANIIFEVELLESNPTK